jgi:ABC-type transporter Mla MlaB component
MNVSLQTHMDRLPAVEGLRYYLHDGAGAVRFVLHGTLAGGSVKELDQCWRTASSTLADRVLLVDISSLVAADEAGHALLQSWRDSGARFVANTTQGRGFLQSITGEPAPAPEQKPETGVYPFLKSLLLVELIVRVWRSITAT